jgi:hypothetical protein
MFSNVTSILAHYGLQYPVLDVLIANQDPYTALLVQPQAEIRVTDVSISNRDSARATNSFLALFDLARKAQAALLVAPEYSVPWAAIQSEIQTGGGPQDGAIWVLGCESISKQELQSLATSAPASVSVIHEDLSELRHPAGATYLNPVVYIFRTRLSSGEDHRLVLLIQFKTEPSGDPDNTEAVSMFRGQQIYLFDGGRNQIRLVTFICSDVLRISSDEVASCAEDALVLHIQLNERPRTNPYATYRRHLFRSRCDRTELICLNWAADIAYYMGGNASAVTKKTIPASIWASRSNEFSSSDQAVESGQARGGYYTRHTKERLHLVNLTYSPAAFIFRATKVKHDSTVCAGQSYRTGPQLLRVMQWSTSSSAWLEKNPHFDDGFSSYCTDFPSVAAQLSSIHATSPLGVERVVSLTAGQFAPRSNWYLAKNLLSAEVTDDEVVRRITVAHDPEGKPYRDAIIGRFVGLDSIRSAVTFKAPLAPLNAGFVFDWTLAYPAANVCASNDPSFRATIVYAGQGNGRSQLRDLYDKTADLARSVGAADRFCVLYLDGLVPKLYEPSVKHSIVNTSPSAKNFTEPST